MVARIFKLSSPLPEEEPEEPLPDLPEISLASTQP